MARIDRLRADVPPAPGARTPELPDVTVYKEALDRTLAGRRVTAVQVVSPFVLRSVDPPPSALVGTTFERAGRIGKRLVLRFSGGLHVIIHLMVAGRLRWLGPRQKATGRITLATIAFEHGTLALTEAAKKKRASLHLTRGDGTLAAFDRGGLDVLAASPEAFVARLRSENHTLKRALTDPRLFDGIGNAYSDEILHRARLSPLQLTRNLGDADAARLHEATRAILVDWTDRLRREAAANEGWPGQVTAFRPDFAVHGRHRLPCPVCGDPVQRIRYAENETNYCATCQTGGRLLADRALSRLLKSDWPRSLDEFDGMMEAAKAT